MDLLNSFLLEKVVRTVIQYSKFRQQALADAQSETNKILESFDDDMERLQK